MEFFASFTSTVDMLECRWKDELSKASDVDTLLPITSFDPRAIANYRDHLKQFIEANGSNELGILQYLNLRLENEIAESFEKPLNKPGGLEAIGEVLESSAFHQVNKGGPGEPTISISLGQHFNEFIKKLTISNAELLFLDEPAIHHWKRSLTGALVILRKFCPDALAQLAGRHVKIVPVICTDRNMSISASHEFVSAIILASWVQPKECAEMLVHEMGHSILADIMSVNPLWREGCDELFYSPFRGDARPVSGLFHAAYSFHNVCVYKSRIVNSASGRLESWARRTLPLDCLRALICSRMLLQSGVLTNQGLGLLKSIEADLKKIQGLIGVAQSDDSVTTIRKHFADWLTNHKNFSPKSVEFFARVIDQTVDNCSVAQPDGASLPAKAHVRTTGLNSSSQSIEYGSISDFWRLGFPSQVSVIRGKAPLIQSHVKFDISEHKDLQVRAIECDSYKGNSSDPYRMMTLGEACDPSSRNYFLFLRNYERISSCFRELESFIVDQDFAIGATEHHLFYNHANVTVPLHTDSANNLHFVLSGQKTFFIAKTGTDFSGTEIGGYEDGFSDFKPFENRNEALELGEFVTLNALDVLFLPIGHWHSVEYHENSISVSIFDEIFTSLQMMGKSHKH